jgi:hypothetical protein
MKDGKGGGAADDDNSANFPVSAFYDLENRVFQDNWSIPYKREEALGRCLKAAAKLAEESEFVYNKSFQVISF